MFTSIHWHIKVLQYYFLDIKKMFSVIFSFRTTTILFSDSIFYAVPVCAFFGFSRIRSRFSYCALSFLLCWWNIPCLPFFARPSGRGETSIIHDLMYVHVCTRWLAKKTGTFCSAYRARCVQPIGTKLCTVLPLGRWHKFLSKFHFVRFTKRATRAQRSTTLKFLL